MVLLLAGEEQHPATVDLCCIDLYVGVLEAMKLGAVATYILDENGVELLQAAEVPAGVLEKVEPVLLSRKLWSDSQVVMISDGILEALPGEAARRWRPRNAFTLLALTLAAPSASLAPSAV